MRIIKDIAPIMVDIDGTLTMETEGYGDKVYSNRTPKLYMITHIRRLYTFGYPIVLWTARFEEDRKVTVEWLKKYGVPYDKIIFDKPQYSMMIDDKCINPDSISFDDIDGTMDQKTYHNFKAIMSRSGIYIEPRVVYEKNSPVQAAQAGKTMRKAIENHLKDLEKRGVVYSPKIKWKVSNDSEVFQNLWEDPLEPIEEDNPEFD